ncbi:MAG: hypothetical protein A2X36_12860 [Elusimicrobia bacterium GWA2_69_24]|nr:MAG: hypothetical protein A2X36_12860 [Elusimicrobia bacterium GWA2_69_24]
MYEQETTFGLDEFLDIRQDVWFGSVIDLSAKLIGIQSADALHGLPASTLAVRHAKDDDTTLLIGKTDDGFPQFTDLRVKGLGIGVPRLALDGLRFDFVGGKAIETLEEPADFG